METTMLRMALIAGIVVLAASWVSGRAQEMQGPSDSARYTFYRVQDKFLRLDVRTGQVSECSWTATGWFCRVAPDERAALESEIARLTASNMALKKELLARGAPLPDGIKPDPQVDKGLGGEMKLPSDAELDRMMSYMEKVWRRLIDMMSNLQRDMQRKS
jgi:hypothetical protein